MTLQDYNLLVKVSLLKEADRIDAMVTSALITRQVNRTDRAGKRYVVKSSKDVFDIEKVEQEILHKKNDSFSKLYKVAKRVEELKARGEYT